MDKLIDLESVKQLVIDTVKENALTDEEIAECGAACGCGATTATTSADLGQEIQYLGATKKDKDETENIADKYTIIYTKEKDDIKEEKKEEKKDFSQLQIQEEINLEINKTDIKIKEEIKKENTDVKANKEIKEENTDIKIKLEKLNKITNI